MLNHLEKYNEYTREIIHNIFSPNTTFTPQRGTWGLQGIVRVPNRLKDYVFMVTFNQTTVDYQFDENITESGILTWQSQPQQSLNESRILDFISHNHNVNNIYLFLRTSKKIPYTYLGKLAYLSHDDTRERPVHFKWQILDWDYTEDLLDRMNLELVDISPEYDYPNESMLYETPRPEKEARRSDKTRSFHGRRVDFAENEDRNRKLGLSGEELVVKMEKQYLISNGRPDLAEKISHVSKVIGDGTGYDILSFDVDGKEMFIEVKTTRGGHATPFYLSASEYEFAKLHTNDYILYRLYNYDTTKDSACFYRLTYSEMSELRRDPINYKIIPNQD